jgi:chromosome segregation ATPase
MDRAASAPAGVQRLFDLINPDHADLRPAFYFAVTETMVAADLDTAVRVAYGGAGNNSGAKASYRVVTMTGKPRP